MRDAATDSRLVFADDGTLIAFGNVSSPPAGGGRVFVGGGVDPAHRGPGNRPGDVRWQWARAAGSSAAAAPPTAGSSNRRATYATPAASPSTPATGWIRSLVVPHGDESGRRPAGTAARGHHRRAVPRLRRGRAAPRGGGGVRRPLRQRAPLVRGMGRPDDPRRGVPAGVLAASPGRRGDRGVRATAYASAGTRCGSARSAPGPVGVGAGSPAPWSPTRWSGRRRPGCPRPTSTSTRTTRTRPAGSTSVSGFVPPIAVSPSVAHFNVVLPLSDVRSSLGRMKIRCRSISALATTTLMAMGLARLCIPRRRRCPWRFASRSTAPAGWVAGPRPDRGSRRVAPGGRPHPGRDAPPAHAGPVDDVPPGVRPGPLDGVDRHHVGRAHVRRRPERRDRRAARPAGEIPRQGDVLPDRRAGGIPGSSAPDGPRGPHAIDRSWDHDESLGRRSPATIHSDLVKQAPPSTGSSRRRRSCTSASPAATSPTGPTASARPWACARCSGTSTRATRAGRGSGPSSRWSAARPTRGSMVPCATAGEPLRRP